MAEEHAKQSYMVSSVVAANESAIRSIKDSSGSADTQLQSGWNSFGKRTVAATESYIDGVHPSSTNSDSAQKKKAKSRKGLAKSFVCTEPGCQKSFTRFEHLGRHRLNHAPKQIFTCSWPGCTKCFVRDDLLVRHLDRHRRRNMNFEAHDHAGSSVSPTPDHAKTTSRSPLTDTQSVVVPKIETVSELLNEDLKPDSGFTPDTNFAEPLKFSVPDNSGEVDTSSPAVASSYQSLSVGFDDITGTQAPLSIAKLMSAPLPTEFADVRPMTDNPTATAASSTDLIDWLFSDGMLSGNRDYFAPDDFNSFLESPIIDISQMSTPPQFSQYKIMSEQAREGLLKLVPSLQNEPDFLLPKVREYMDLYWEKFHFQFPILHRRSFDVDLAPAPLLLSMTLIGGSYARARHITEQIAEPLRWIIFGSPDFHPPTKAWVLQSLLLLEIYEKMLSTRRLHERAHIHHGATLQLIRRGSTLHDSSTVSIPGDGDENTWKRWVEAESIKRAVFVAFILDVTHSILFGHSILMFAHEMRLSLPCDEAIWDSTEDQRKQLLSKPALPFLVALKRILNQQTVEVDSLGRLVLSCGVMSLAIQMSHQALQVSSIGWGSFRDTWKSTISRAYDFWLTDYVPQRHQKQKVLVSDAASVDSCSNSDSDMGPMFVLLHHMAQICMHVARYDLHVFCYDKRVLGRSTLEQDVLASKRHMYEWAQSPGGIEAAYHSLKALYKTLILGDESPKIYRISPVVESATPCGYSAVDDIFIHRAAMIVHCTLVYWAYAYCRCGPESKMLVDTRRASQNGLASKEQEWAMAAESGRAFLERMNRGAVTPSDLDQMENRHLTVGLLKWVILSLRGSEWELLEEMIAILEGCVQRSLGKEIYEL
ncbi:fungal-specific transcription factor domain-containing protein [Kockiozyma suomiensis]|uniref:fungal-specific transcription factor domain-containing protein n=1 Tax=Kockiozyma suomiensis TaxID=1337062 RepID=UPI003343AF63